MKLLEETNNYLIMQAINISVIIPHYNIPELLVRALRSIPQRKDVQIIVVDDGSPDADKYIERYPELSMPNVEYYPQPHCGLAGRMRNIGLQYAKGEWITFLDADDLFAKDADKIFAEIQQYNEDIVFYRSIAVKNDDLLTPSNRYGFDSLFTIESKKEQERYFRYLYSSPIGKFIKKDLITTNNIRFEEVPYWNDVYFSVYTGICAKDVRVCTDVLYVITERCGSLTSDIKDNKKERLNKCNIRLGVALRTYRLLCEHKIYFPIEDHHLTKAVGLFRSKDKREYFLLLLKVLFICPACTIFYIKKDLLYAYHKIVKP